MSIESVPVPSDPAETLAKMQQLHEAFVAEARDRLDAAKGTVNTDTHFVQPKITGYRQLSPHETELMNRIKAKGVELGALVQELRNTTGLDQRWVSIGATDLQTGLMALTRGVAQPTTF